MAGIITVSPSSWSVIGHLAHPSRTIRW
jgi:hypothetical protein